MNVREEFIKAFLQHTCPPQFGEGTATRTLYRDKAIAAIDSNDMAFVMFKQGVAAAALDKPVVYLAEFVNAEGNKPAVSISNLSMGVDGSDEDRAWESNKMFLLEPNHMGNGMVRTCDTATTLRNILGNAGITVITE